MKFYDYGPAPSPRRVRIFLAEKGLSLPTVQINLRDGEHLGEAFRAINPEMTVPVLELDDGRRLIDAIAICRYVEALHPAPALFGQDPADTAFIEEWQRRCERDGFYAVMESFRNYTKGFKNRALPGPVDYEQIPALAERGRLRVQHFLGVLDRRLAQSPYVASDAFSVADITAMVTVDFARWIKLEPPAEAVHLRRWYQTVSSRPSAQA